MDHTWPVGGMSPPSLATRRQPYIPSPRADENVVNAVLCLLAKSYIISASAGDIGNVVHVPVATICGVGRIAKIRNCCPMRQLRDNGHPKRLDITGRSHLSGEATGQATGPTELPSDKTMSIPFTLFSDCSYRATVLQSVAGPLRKFAPEVGVD